MGCTRILHVKEVPSKGRRKVNKSKGGILLSGGGDERQDLTLSTSELCSGNNSSLVRPPHGESSVVLSELKLPDIKLCILLIEQQQKDSAFHVI